MKLLKYLQGFRKGKEAHRLEKEAMQDSFLADAMDGYDSAKGNPVERIDELRRRVSARSVGRRRHQALGWSIAACLLLGIGISTYFIHQKEGLPEDTKIAVEATTQPPSAAPDAEEAIAQVRLNRETDAMKADREASEQALQHSAVEEEESVSEPSVAQPMTENIHIVSDSTWKAATVTLLADTREVRGKVTDQHGEPLIGASIVVKGTNQGVISDLDGNFALKVDGQKELVVNYIGYEAVTLPADTGKNLLVAMNDDKRPLDELVVTGYGVQKRKSIMGSITASKVSGKSKPAIGWKAYRKYLKENLHRPTDAECKHVKGKVVLTFCVDRVGRPQDITVKTPLCPSADKEAVNLIERGPDWTVGNKQVEVSIKF